MNPTGDRQLIEYFRGRKVWLLRADEDPPQLTPYGLTPKPRSAVELATRPAGPRS
jgi:hypothetical protein